jgi:phosphate acetyltransferase
MGKKVVEKIIRRARQLNRRVLLPETGDPRVLRAARRISDEGYAHVVLLGDPRDTEARGRQLDLDLTDIETIDHRTDPDAARYADVLHERRKHKGMSRQDARKLLQNAVYYGGMMVGQGRVDGMVAGSICPTRDTVRSALFGVGLAEGIKTLSACSVIHTVVPEVGVDGTLLFADTGVVPEPTVEQLADIAIAAADACKALLDVEPSVAMLSFSTKGSARSPAVQAVIDATRLARQRRPEINIDGELQVDAAIIPSVAERKAAGSPLAGRANVLIFPSLSCGNIAYKLVERLGKGTALGPLLLGLARPVNDLSRGCRAEDIALVTAITAVQAVKGT